MRTVHARRSTAVRLRHSARRPLGPLVALAIQDLSADLWRAAQAKTALETAVAEGDTAAAGLGAPSPSTVGRTSLSAPRVYFAALW